MNKLKGIINRVPLGVFKALFIIGVFLVFAQVYHWFFSIYTIQSPVVIEIRPPVVEKFISPISEDTSTVITPQQEKPKEATNSAELTPTPTPKEKAQRFDLIGTVDAAEMPVYTGEVADYIREKFGRDADLMLEVAQCESGMQAYNWYNKWLGATKEQADQEGYAVGVFMVYRKVHQHFTMDELLDYKTNIDYAYQLYEANGVSPWEASRHCWGK